MIITSPSLIPGAGVLSSKILTLGCGLLAVPFVRAAALALARDLHVWMPFAWVFVVLLITGVLLSPNDQLLLRLPSGVLEWIEISISHIYFCKHYHYFGRSRRLALMAALAYLLLRVNQSVPSADFDQFFRTICASAAVYPRTIYLS